MNSTAALPRHEWIETWCTFLHDMTIGDSITCASDATLGAQAIVITLPTYAWIAPAIHMGRKAISHDGGIFAMPVRIQWEHGPVHVLTSHGVTIEWTLAGLGHTEAGSISIERTNDGTLAISGDTRVTHGITYQPTTRPALELGRLRAQGQTARWAATMHLERFVEKAVARAVTNLSRDILNTDNPDPILDALSCDQVRDRMLLGSDGRPGAVARLIDRCLKPHAFLNVDPLKYVITDLNRTADDYVRRAIDDPRVGTRFRRLARSMPHATQLQDVIDAYRTAYPYDADVSTDRAIKALTAGRDAMSASIDLGYLADLEGLHPHRTATRRTGPSHFKVAA